ncbi:transposase [Catellatospora sp. TT07R-123]|uniref:transposase n=1 Tax=Catellatospora sp. TT07R-123 TaxID=2733863 RepID=UPI001BB31602|nr:transposase [Catellatospora sp. TT07R-123]
MSGVTCVELGHPSLGSRGRRLAFALTGGQVSDFTAFEPLMAAIHGPRIGPGRPRVRPDHVIADKAYSSRANRALLRSRDITTVIPEPNDQIANRKRRGRTGGRPPNFDRAAYRKRNQVERGFNRRKHWRGLATRFDKLASHYQATLDLVEALDWLRAVPDRNDPRDRT